MNFCCTFLLALIRLFGKNSDKFLFAKFLSYLHLITIDSQLYHYQHCHHFILVHLIIKHSSPQLVFGRLALVIGHCIGHSHVGIFGNSRRYWKKPILLVPIATTLIVH
ncbi:hypothetical protein KFK09_021868 [Dendrobium nobile]|uniref:Secreted protein n=1 Tax=Dendrobium nobile TaxID=94219 RepID=A0A8T3AGX9_DENNO|nr:hypothetical protein KFK09_021868 [Dendrobium nobile]